MKILLIHNFYQSSSPSGEDMVYKAEKELLEVWGKKYGLRVTTYKEYNNKINNFSLPRKFLLPFKTAWSRETYKALRNIIKNERPDIAHFHNIFYLISPSAYYACKDAGVPIVQTLHNFRFFCANGLLMRDGKICEDCIGKIPWRGMLHGCHRNSRLYSAPAVLTGCVHRFLGTWKDKVDAYIALTEFGKKKIVECGLPEEKIFVKPNFLSNPPKPNYVNGGFAVFLGRLSEEKGLNIILEAFKILQSSIPNHVSLKVIGSGPQQKQFEDKVRAENVYSIECIGRKGFAESMAILKNSMFMIMPSVWYETFGKTIIEAFACGKPVIASRLGAMAEIVEHGKTGLLFKPGNSNDLASKITWMIENEVACVEMGKNARAEFVAKYTAEKNYEILMNIYQKTIENDKKEKK